MKKNKILAGAILGSLIFPSCGSNGHISRVSYKETDYENATNIHKNMKSAQENSFINNCSTYIKYSIKATGKARLDRMTFHNLNVNASAGFEISWSIDDQYLKLEGEEETYYYIFNKNDNKWWRYESFLSSGRIKKYKVIYDEMGDNFKEFIYDILDDYGSLLIPIILGLGTNITGDNSYCSEYLFQMSFVPDDLFDEDVRKLYLDYGEKYKKENEGYYTSLNYYSDDNNTVSSNLKCKIKTADLQSSPTKEGYVNMDMFAAYKDNFLTQSEFIISGNDGDSKQDNFNVDFNGYLSQEVYPDKCTIDDVNPDDYETIYS